MAQEIVFNFQKICNLHLEQKVSCRLSCSMPCQRFFLNNGVWLRCLHSVHPGTFTTSVKVQNGSCLVWRNKDAILHRNHLLLVSLARNNGLRDFPKLWFYAVAKISQNGHRGVHGNVCTCTCTCTSVSLIFLLAKYVKILFNNFFKI